MTDQIIKLTMSIVRPYFTMKLRTAALSIGVSPTTLKVWCRENNIERWPYRKWTQLMNYKQEYEKNVAKYTGCVEKVRLIGYSERINHAIHDLEYNGRRSPGSLQIRNVQDAKHVFVSFPHLCTCL